MQFAERGAVLRAQKARDQPWRAGIEAQAGIGIEGGDAIQIAAQQRRGRRGGGHPGDAGMEFPCFPGFGSGQIVQSRARVGIQDKKSSLLLLQARQKRYQDHMLEDIGDASGVVCVTVVHERG